MAEKSTQHNTINPFFKEILVACNRIRAMDGSTVFVSQKSTNYVVPGHTYTVSHQDKAMSFWVGVNDKRMFFIVYNNIDQETAKDKFQFTFGGSTKAGWQINYENIEITNKDPSISSELKGVSIWGSCTSEQPLTEKKDRQEDFESGFNVKQIEVLSTTGKYWATDIAMMVQSWFRTCERFKIEGIKGMEPEPL